MTRTFLALGGNLGPVEQTFRETLDALDAPPELSVVQVSCVYRTAPVGDNAGGEFRNAAAEIQADLPPLSLLDRLQSMESGFGRQRGLRWGPRPLDLDVLLYGNEIIEHARLRVPHPACWYRRFVLDPLAEIAADVVHPEKRVPVGELRSRLLVRPLPVVIAGADHATRSRLVTELAAEFPEAALLPWPPAESSPPALLLWLGPAPDGEPERPSWDTLPHLPRLDASTAGEDVESFVREVLQSALSAGRPGGPIPPS